MHLETPVVHNVEQDYILCRHGFVRHCRMNILGQNREANFSLTEWQIPIYLFAFEYMEGELQDEYFEPKEENKIYLSKDNVADFARILCNKIRKDKL